jgi:hypothetical protein
VVERGLNTSIAALRVIGGDGKVNPVAGGITGPPVPGEYKYEDIALQVGSIPNLRQ